MIESIETSLDIAFNEPFGSCPGLFHLPQRGMTASVRTKPMRMRAKLWLVVGFQDEPDYLLQQLVRPGWYTQGTQFAVLLRYVGPSHWGPSKPLLAKLTNECFDFLERHGIYSFAGYPFGHSSLVGIQASVGHQIQVWIVPFSIEVFQRQPSFATFMNDSQDRVGVPHLAYLLSSQDRMTCLPSPCKRLSRSRITMEAPSPFASRRVGDPVFRLGCTYRAHRRRPTHSLQ